MPFSETMTPASPPGSNPPTLCMVYDAIADGRGSIPSLVLGYVKVALEACWRVTCVANEIDPSIKGEVEWLPLHIPPKSFFVKWISARRNIRAAIGERSFDVTHVHQAQVAALSDVMQCHFLSRVALERHCLESRRGLKHRAARAQQQAVVHAEDYYFKHWNPRTRMLFNSDLTRQEFARLYGMPPRQEVFLCDVPPLDFPDEEEKRAARRALLGAEPRGLVVGYLGGVDTRKGFHRLIKALGNEKELFLLIGGTGSKNLEIPGLVGRYKALGMVSDTSQFYAACDVVVVPSLFEPFGLVATEAASRGVPVIATDEVGALPHLIEFGAGARWQPETSLGAVARDLIERLDHVQVGARRLAETFSRQKQGQQLLQIYAEVKEENRTKLEIPLHTQNF